MRILTVVFFVFCVIKLNTFEFSTFDQTKQATLMCHLALWEISLQFTYAQHSHSRTPMFFSPLKFWKTEKKDICYVAIYFFMFEQHKRPRVDIHIPTKNKQLLHTKHSPRHLNRRKESKTHFMQTQNGSTYSVYVFHHQYLHIEKAMSSPSLGSDNRCCRKMPHLRDLSILGTIHLISLIINKVMIKAWKSTYMDKE